MEIVKRKSINEYLNKFLITAKNSDFIEITEWTNGEGWDIVINERVIQLHMDELKAINYLVMCLDYEKEV